MEPRRVGRLAARSIQCAARTDTAGQSFLSCEVRRAHGRTHTSRPISELPLTTKQELVDSAAADPAGISTHHTYPASSYSRLHRTSGTSGHPLLVLDTATDWQWWSSTWQHVLQAAQVTEDSRVFLAFSFGPFIGFWSAHQACVDRGAIVIPGGGLSSLARLEFMRQHAADVVCCTPSYALHLVEVARKEDWPLAQLGVKRLIVAGEAGGSVPAVREQLERTWQAQVIDHAGATEIGPWGFGWPDRPGLHVIESRFIAELLPIDHAIGLATRQRFTTARTGAHFAGTVWGTADSLSHRRCRASRCGSRQAAIFCGCLKEWSAASTTWSPFAVSMCFPAASTRLSGRFLGFRSIE